MNCGFGFGSTEQTRCFRERYKDEGRGGGIVGKFGSWVRGSALCVTVLVVDAEESWGVVVSLTGRRVAAQGWRTGVGWVWDGNKKWKGFSRTAHTPDWESCI